MVRPLLRLSPSRSLGGLHLRWGCLPLNRPTPATLQLPRGLAPCLPRPLATRIHTLLSSNIYTSSSSICNNQRTLVGSVTQAPQPPVHLLTASLPSPEVPRPTVVTGTTWVVVGYHHSSSPRRRVIRTGLELGMTSPHSLEQAGRMALSNLHLLLLSAEEEGRATVMWAHLRSSVGVLTMHRPTTSVRTHPSRRAQWEATTTPATRPPCHVVVIMRRADLLHPV